MKRVSILRILSFMVIAFTFSCSSGGDDPVKLPEEEGKTTAITIETKDNKTEVKKGETLSFVVKNQKKEVLKENVSIFVDDAKITGETYKFEEVKEYSVYAEYKGIKSSKITIKAIASNITIEAKGGKTEVTQGDVLEFVVKDEDQNELKEKVSIFVDDKKIDGFSYKFDEVKEYLVYAEYEGVKSPKITIKVTADNISTHTTKVLIEDYTGTWCGWCARMAYKIEDVTKKYKNAIPVALHYKDSLNFKETSRMMNFFGVSAFPTLKLNRNTSADYDNVKEKVAEGLAKKVNLGLAISSSLSDKSLTVKVKVHYDFKSKGKNKLVVYLLENGLISSQKNYSDNDPDSPLYKKGDPIEDFEHNHVARMSLTDIFGDEIPEDKNAAGAIYEKEFNVTLPSSIKDSSKLDIVAFVVGSTFKAINVQKAKVGEDQPFD